MSGVEGKVAVVVGAGAGVAKEIALALAARGARIVVTGQDERALGETVGEIAYGGGKARHVVGDPMAAAARAIDVFGSLDIVVAGAGADLGAVVERITASGCILLIANAPAPIPAGPIRCNAIVAPEEHGSAAAEVAVLLCSSRLAGRTVSIH
jgi:NAD(P)-dependent dehydrogenase (short-subunit alcohol dehydrogenase family)